MPVPLNLGNPPLSFMMSGKFMGSRESAPLTLYRYLLRCGHWVEVRRERQAPVMIFCPDCAQSWAESTAEDTTL